jgi:hypothetical protein
VLGLSYNLQCENIQCSSVFKSNSKVQLQLHKIDFVEGIFIEREWKIIEKQETKFILFNFYTFVICARLISWTFNCKFLQLLLLLQKLYRNRNSVIFILSYRKTINGEINLFNAISLIFFLGDWESRAKSFYGNLFMTITIVIGLMIAFI